MSLFIDTAYRSLNKFGEELCGDNVVVERTENSTIIVLADGLGSGVKANILSTLTSKILGTMLKEGASVEESVATIVSTLPVCSVRQMAYCTFSILEISDSGDAYLVEFDNPFCFFIRNGEIMSLPCEYTEYSGKGVYETRFTVMPDDVLTLVSDGVIYAGVGETLNFGWTWENVAAWLQRAVKPEISAPRLCAMLSEAVDDLYMQRPGDDSTVFVAKVLQNKTVNIFSGPPKNKEDDPKMVKDYMKSVGAKVICGGTSANIVARVLHRSVKTSLKYYDPLIPPVGYIEGIDLVTEGVLTISRAVEILQEYHSKKDSDAFFFRKLDEENAAAKLAKLLLENCTTLRLFVGTAVNPAHQNPNLPSDLSIKLKLIDKLALIMEQLGKRVEKFYY